MAKPKTLFTCQECGNIQQKWSGQCSACGVWDSIIEENPGAMGKPIAQNGKTHDFVPLSGESKPSLRTTTHIAELDRVLGGGLVEGAAILIGGDPGIGKSTLVLQLLAKLCQEGKKTAYISGEESVDQIRLRAKRLGVQGAQVELMIATSVKDIIASTSGAGKPEVLVIDSVQTMYLDDITSAPGTVSQVKAATNTLIAHAKTTGITLVLIGHVTKEGQIAGPKVLEHMVDAVLYFEGERGHPFRILRAIKNRFGAANEIGVFQMEEGGLAEVANPSALFLSEHAGEESGVAVFAGMEGTRPVLVEVQALVTPTLMPTPRRAVVGWDNNRLAMILAILQTRCGIFLGDKEVYLNMAGGLKINEPAADLAVAAALLSAVSGVALPRETVIFGEVGLSGEVRMVSNADMRIKEAQKLGFKQAILPKSKRKENNGFILKEIKNIREVQPLIGAVGRMQQSNTQATVEVESYG